MYGAALQVTRLHGYRRNRFQLAAGQPSRRDLFHRQTDTYGIREGMDSSHCKSRRRVYPELQQLRWRQVLERRRLATQFPTANDGKIRSNDGNVGAAVTL